MTSPKNLCQVPTAGKTKHGCVTPAVSVPTKLEGENSTTWHIGVPTAGKAQPGSSTPGDFKAEKTCVHDHFYPGFPKTAHAMRC